jgi:hypothetical protein
VGLLCSSSHDCQNQRAAEEKRGVQLRCGNGGSGGDRVLVEPADGRQGIGLSGRRQCGRMLDERKIMLARKWEGREWEGR